MTTEQEAALSQLGTRYLPVRAPGKGQVLAMVDDDYDGEWLSSLPWRLIQTSQRYEKYYVQLEPHIRRHLGLQSHYLHQFVMPKKEGYWVSFRNGNHLDCRSVNLEYRTPKDINKNSRPLQSVEASVSRKKGGLAATEYRGVQRGFFSDSKNNVVNQFGNKPFYAAAQGKFIGWFDTAEEAALAYDKRALEIWGDRALPILNFPQERSEHV